MSDVRQHFAVTWAQAADLVEAQLAAVDPFLFAAAQVASGETVLDVGCGRGATTAVAAAMAGREGRVCGVDVAEPLLAAARAIHARAPGAPIDWLAADAQTHPFAPGAVDVVLSRFGTLFFEEPVAAFVNLRQATRPGGRLAAVVWLPRDESEMFARPIAAARASAGELGIDLDVGPQDDGPFRYGVEPVMLDVLAAAGWDRGRFTPYDVTIATGPSVTPAQAATIPVTLGPCAQPLQGTPPEVVEHITAAIAADLATAVTAAGLRLSARIAVVTASVPPG